MPIPITARAPVEFRPPSKPGVTIIINVPTPYQRDAFAASLARAGVVHYTRSQIRDLMLAAVSATFPDDFDTYRENLEEVWSADDAQGRANLLRAQLEVEMREKSVAQYKGVEPTDKQRKTLEKDIAAALNKIQPDVVVDMQKRVAVAALQQDMMSRFAPLQKALGELAEQQTKRNWLTIETYVHGWRDLPDNPDGDGKDPSGITRAEAEYMRQHIGMEAFNETGDFIFALMSLDGDEEKNLASLLENMSAPTGSTASESTASSEDGTSTDEPSGSIPEPA